MSFLCEFRIFASRHGTQAGPTVIFYTYNTCLQALKRFFRCLSIKRVSWACQRAMQACENSKINLKSSYFSFLKHRKRNLDLVKIFHINLLDIFNLLTSWKILTQSAYCKLMTLFRMNFVKSWPHQHFSSCPLWLFPTTFVKFWSSQNFTKEDDNC